MRSLIIVIGAVLALSGGAVAAGKGNDRGHGHAADQGRAHGQGHGNGRLPGPVRDSDFHDEGRPDPAKVELGRFLFFDKELSGNRNISCATCHHSLTDTGDGLSLPVGEGGSGLGVTRDTGQGVHAIPERVPRNAPPVFNLGAGSMTHMFHDGRVTIDPSRPSGFFSPAGDDLPPGLDNVLAAQAMFPVTSGTEMAGQLGENSIANAAAVDNLAGPDGVWDQLAYRLQAIPAYVELFIAAYDDIQQAGDITFVHAANAIAAFEASAWRADDSPFDAYLRGDREAMSRQAVAGMRLFYGKARCSSCHSGKFQTDMAFHAIAMPQIGPGKGNGPDGHDDFGRELVTGDIEDRYRFRTPPLRNVALTGPWGHGGAYNTLRAVVEHHLDPTAGLEGYDTDQVVMPRRDDLDLLDFVVHNDPTRRWDIAAANTLEPVRLRPNEVDDLLAFLHALTDPGSIDLRGDVPTALPSGLPLFD
ncbi:MAG: cytochrome c peroxidase [Gammaproteobacteria bacterium]|nr:cytochrome c peroxidase [Gammaproteobacteria bacterium]